MTNGHSELWEQILVFIDKHLQQTLTLLSLSNEKTTIQLS